MKSRYVRIVLPLLVLLTAIVLMMPRTERFGYDYRQGAAWTHETLVSRFSFPILKTPDQLLQENQSRSTVVVPYYKQLGRVPVAAIAKADSLAALGFAELSRSTENAMIKIYSDGVVPDEGVKVIDGTPSEVIFVQREKRASRQAVSEVFRLSDAKAALLLMVSTELPDLAVDSLFRAFKVYDCIQPDLYYDSEMTRMVSADNTADVSPTLGYIPAGQVLISEGEIVTEEIDQILDSYKHEYESNVGSGHAAIVHWLGNIGIALAIVLLLVMAIRLTNPTLFDRLNEFLYLLCVVLLMAAAALIMQRVNPRFLFLVPFTLGALLLQAFFEKKFAFAVYPVTLLPLLTCAENGLVLFVMYFLAGSAAIMFFKYFSRRWKQFILAFITFAILAAAFLSFRAVHLSSENVWQILLMLFVGSMLTVAGYPLTFLFERIFNLISDARLEELCVTSNKILTQLEQKAPGTFQHSLQVMNMADTAARAVGAKTLLVRAGALYHDIGKINNPLCFIENESLVVAGAQAGYHSELTPLQSSHDITRHVTDGAELADHFKLPAPVKAFILSHHGTTLTSFFYSKHLKEGGSPDDIEQFRYKGIKPHTREQVILMVADSIEAASRTLKSYSPQALSDLVESIVAGKMDDGQFDESPITLKEISLMKEAFKSYLGQMFHERIAYPKRTKNNK